MNYNDENLLQMVELYAAEVGLISSEDEATEQFDNEIAPAIIEAHGVKGEAFTDSVMMNEAFSEWLDMMTKDGVIHPEQYQHYCYTGRYSD